jgi:hypothetical protein
MKMSVATVIRIDALIKGFPHKPAKILGLPTLETLKELKQANALSVSSNLGGGNHSYLGVVLDTQIYAIIVGNNPHSYSSSLRFWAFCQSWLEGIKLLERKNCTYLAYRPTRGKSTAT